MVSIVNFFLKQTFKNLCFENLGILKGEKNIC